MKKVGKDETPFIEKTKTPIGIIGNLDQGKKMVSFERIG
jgi:hypothetical protein